MTIETVYDSHVDKVYKFFYIKCLDRDIAEDLTSQTFMLLCEQMQIEGRQIDNYTKFLYGIMRNVWLMHLRRKYQRPELAIEGIDDFEDYVDTAIEDYAGLTVKQRAEIIINQLPEKQREVVTRRLLHEQPIADVARDLGHDRNYVKTTYKRGLKRMKQLIAANGLVELGKEAL